ncbi:hypothetical protein BU26DRAFT_89249 [Trematosphaeria pertusa]|uniref:Uncharacterized protein n=1 Tax=Trematosphaeria pertusa TaxID=390896 RepID=A0A6A6I403_9PLEO|nr:uncharacterized protein BU26DRAFT_89249 [Trematosphaeria pertusa]KAF2244919.1 hypothetical protein BU26DRAFT_89249 [Trematosphaeria pertusa]
MAETIAPTPAPTPNLKAQPIIQEKLRPWSTAPQELFDPSKHLSYVSEPKSLSLNDLGLSEHSGEHVAISPMGCSEPFPLFSNNAITIMRSEIFTNEVWDNCLHSTEFAGCQLRGHCPK